VNAEARMIGKVCFIEKLCPNVHSLVLTVFSVCQPWRWSRPLVNDMNAGGVLLEDHLWAMPAHVRMVTLSGVCHG
jgi:hypothetical protein